MGKHPLAFLGKKSWHTKNLKNVEKVWIAQEKEKAEEKKLQDLQKQIIEERQMNELRELQAQAGIRKVPVEKLDWMYEGPMSASKEADAKEAEEYLLGKAFQPKGATEALTEQISRTSEQPGALWAKASSQPSANDSFTRMHEDPMMKIRAQELRAREGVVKNPLKMNRVKTEIEAQLRADRDAKKEHKRAKKEAKKARKKEKKFAKKAKKRGWSPSRSSSSASESEGEGRSALAAAAPASTGAPRDPRYGLQQGKAVKGYSAAELGPSAEHRARAREGNKPAAVEKKRPRPVLTEAERAARLRVMAEDAEHHEHHRDERIGRERAAAAAESAQAAAPGSEEPATFLKAMERDVYLSGNIDMEERVKRNRQNHQKDLGGDSFMRK